MCASGDLAGFRELAMHESTPALNRLQTFAKEID